MKGLFLTEQESRQIAINFLDEMGCESYKDNIEIFSDCNGGHGFEIDLADENLKISLCTYSNGSVSRMIISDTVNRDYYETNVPTDANFYDLLDLVSETVEKAYKKLGI